jgi:Fibronectin type III domain
MRRARVLALLATAIILPITACDPTPDAPPTEAEAPTPELGEITFPAIARTPIDGLINAEECTTTSTSTIRLKAQTDTGNRVVQYQLYAANDKAIKPGTTGTTGTSGRQPDCETSFNTTTGLIVAPVGDLRSDHLNGSFILNVDYVTSTIVGAATLPGVDPCAATKDIILCFQARDQNQNNVGVARVKLTLVIDKPQAPILQSVTPGEGALNVKWDAPNPVVNEYYEVQAVTTTATPGVVTTITSPPVTGRELRVEGLTNGTAYGVQVRAFSDADNPSDPSTAITASPTPVADFSEAYKAAGGRDSGGCGTGGVGVLALVGLFAVAALRRRS